MLLPSRILTAAISSLERLTLRDRRFAYPGRGPEPAARFLELFRFIDCIKRPNLCMLLMALGGDCFMLLLLLPSQ